ncbi:MAG: B12-binding domain-containing radical SAM protein [Lachnospiraceae bacterium]
MKILLVAINAKYIHSNLAVYSLCAYAKKNIRGKKPEIEIAEYTINQQQDEILRDIYEKKADVVCFSCYIWNLSYVESLVCELGKICADSDIWLGGPEVSYDAGNVLKRLASVKGVMMGEGERTFSELCEKYEDFGTEALKESGIDDAAFDTIAGITFRKADGTVRENLWREPMDLSEVPFVYDDMKKFENKIIYYETSRGCPFSCSYCLSSIDKRLRFRNLELVKKELQFFLDKKVAQVKFVDRTFNCRHDHAMAVWNYIKEHDNGVTNFHFEVSADLLNEEELGLIETMRPGLIQLEIGVQSTNQSTIREIKRTMNFAKLSETVSRIREMKNVHQHLDLIAGLPYEDKESFVKSFDDVYALKPHQLQLGFLKVLKGSYMEEKRDDYGLVYKSTPPYEVLYTKWLSYEDVLELKGIEEMVEVYYNSRQFEHTLKALEQEYLSEYQLYRELWIYYKSGNLLGILHKRSARYEILLSFISDSDRLKSKKQYFRELLIYDYYLRENAKTRPAFAGENALGKDEIRRFYENEEKKHTFLKDYEKYDKNQMRKMTHLEYFPTLNKTVLFDYMQRNPLNQEARNLVVK